MNDKSRFWKDLTSGRFVSMVKESSKGQSLSNSVQAYHVLKPLFAEEDDVEKVYFVFLDGQNKILGIENLFTGSIKACCVYPREIVRKVIHHKASAFLMGHNHPAGDVTPSAEDKSMTIKVGIAAASIDVQFHDHIIVGDGYHSMSDTGWLRSVSRQFKSLLKSDPPREGGV